jgi:hypothetical protein
VRQARHLSGRVDDDEALDLVRRVEQPAPGALGLLSVCSTR